MLLRARVRLQPATEAFVRSNRRPIATWLQRLFLEFPGGVDEIRPARIGRQRFALFQHQRLEFLNAQVLDQELDARTAAILLLAQSREDARHGLRQRQDFLDRNEIVEQLGHVGHRTEAAANKRLKPAFLDAVFIARDSDESDVVQARQPAGMLRATAERGLELAPETLAIRMAEQKLSQGMRIGSDIEHFVLANACIWAGGNV